MNKQYLSELIADYERLSIYGPRGIVKKKYDPKTQRVEIEEETVLDFYRRRVRDAQLQTRPPQGETRQGILPDPPHRLTPSWAVENEACTAALQEIDDEKRRLADIIWRHTHAFLNALKRPLPHELALVLQSWPLPLTDPDQQVRFCEEVLYVADVLGLLPRGDYAPIGDAGNTLMGFHRKSEKKPAQPKDGEGGGDETL